MVLELFKESLTQLPQTQQMQVLSKLIHSLATSGTVTIPCDFLIFALKAMEHLKKSGRSKVVYSLVRGLGTMRDDQSNSLFPTKRMPMGALQYAVNLHPLEIRYINTIIHRCM